MRQWTVRLALLPALAMSLGCSDARPSPFEPKAATPSSTPSLFDPSSAGTIRGTVIWDGDLPHVPPFEIRTLVTAANPPKPRLIRENPHAPFIDPTNKGVAGAVVFLRKVDVQKARPWDHAAVSIEHHDRRLWVVQGNEKSKVGFVRLGDAITMVSREKVFNSLHAGGSAFFTLTFPDPDKPLTRVLKGPGLVEFSSAAGYYWMRAYLFVADHPYFARTDAKGAFELSQVPAGRYQVICWMPNWHVKSQDRHPESGLVSRVFFQPAVELERELIVEADAEARVEFRMDAALFKQ